MHDAPTGKHYFVEQTDDGRYAVRAKKVSQKDRFRNKTRLIPRVLWAVRCIDPIRRAWDSMMQPLTPFPAAA